MENSGPYYLLLFHSAPWSKETIYHKTRYYVKHYLNYIIFTRICLTQPWITNVPFCSSNDAKLEHHIDNTKYRKVHREVATDISHIYYHTIISHRTQAPANETHAIYDTVSPPLWGMGTDVLAKGLWHNRFSRRLAAGVALNNHLTHCWGNFIWTHINTL